MSLNALIFFPEPERYRTLIEPHATGYKVQVVDSLEKAQPLMSEVEVLLSLNSTGSRLVAHAPKLRWVQSLISGTDAFERVLKDRPQILLSSMCGIHGPQVSEHAFLLMLALIRKLPYLIHAQDASRWDHAEPSLIQGKRVGIAGYGIIGAALAQRCNAFGMKVRAFGSTRREEPGLEGFHLYSELPEVAPLLDFLVMLAPLNAKTEGMIDAKVFNAMKPTAFFVNVGRGPTVNETALVDTLRNRRIAGAGLDALPQEPLPSDHPLWTMPNVIVTPHAAGWHDGYAEQTIPTVARNLELFAQGRVGEMVNLVKR